MHAAALIPALQGAGPKAQASPDAPGFDLTLAGLLAVTGPVAASPEAGAMAPAPLGGLVGATGSPAERTTAESSELTTDGERLVACDASLLAALLLPTSPAPPSATPALPVPVESATLTSGSEGPARSMGGRAVLATATAPGSHLAAPITPPQGGAGPTTSIIDASAPAATAATPLQQLAQAMGLGPDGPTMSHDNTPLRTQEGAAGTASVGREASGAPAASAKGFAGAEGTSPEPVGRAQTQLASDAGKTPVTTRAAAQAASAPAASPPAPTAGSAPIERSAAVGRSLEQGLRVNGVPSTPRSVEGSAPPAGPIAVASAYADGRAQGDQGGFSVVSAIPKASAGPTSVPAALAPPEPPPTTPSQAQALTAAVTAESLRSPVQISEPGQAQAQPAPTTPASPEGATVLPSSAAELPAPDLAIPTQLGTPAAAWASTATAALVGERNPKTAQTFERTLDTGLTPVAEGAAKPAAAAGGASNSPSNPNAGDESPHRFAHLEAAAPADPAEPVGGAKAFESPLVEPAASSGPAAETRAPAAPVRASLETAVNLAAAMARKLDGRNTRFEVALDPLGLGVVNVSIEIGADGKVSAQLAFERPEAAAELRSRAGELQRALEQAGFDLSKGGLSFEHGGGRERGGAQGDQPRHQHARAEAFQQALLAAEAADTLPAQALRLRDRPRAGLDVRI